MSETSSLLPNFIIAGAPKSGTSSVHAWIADHPDALGSTEKETYYFVDPGTHMHNPKAHIFNGLGDYHKCFDASETQAPKVVLESTPAYMYYQTALDHLPALDSQPRFLFIVREPAAQVYSLFNYFQNNWNWIPSNLSFEDYLAAVRQGDARFKGNELAQNALDHANYVKHLDRWLEKLGPNRMMVRTFDDLLADQKQFTMNVAQWVGLDPTFYETYAFPRENETYAVKAGWLQDINVAVRKYLPKGALYNKLRDAYRGLNTTKPTGPDSDDRALVAALREEFHEANQKLSARYGLDVASWNAS